MVFLASFGLKFLCSDFDLWISELSGVSPSQSCSEQLLFTIYYAKSILN